MSPTNYFAHCPFLFKHSPKYPSLFFFFSEAASYAYRLHSWETVLIFDLLFSQLSFGPLPYLQPLVYRIIVLSHLPDHLIQSHNSGANYRHIPILPQRLLLLSSDASCSFQGRPRNAHTKPGCSSKETTTTLCLQNRRPAFPRADFAA